MGRAALNQRSRIALAMLRRASILAVNRPPAVGKTRARLQSSARPTDRSSAGEDPASPKSDTGYDTLVDGDPSPML